MISAAYNSLILLIRGSLVHPDSYRDQQGEHSKADFMSAFFIFLMCRPRPRPCRASGSNRGSRSLTEMWGFFCAYYSIVELIKESLVHPDCYRDQQGCRYKNKGLYFDSMTLLRIPQNLNCIWNNNINESLANHIKLIIIICFCILSILVNQFP